MSSLVVFFLGWFKKLSYCFLCFIDKSSVANAKKGDVDDATSNVFGSNIFDILVGLGLPLLIYSIMVGPLTIVFGHLEIIIALLLMTLLAIYFFLSDNKLTKKEGAVLLALYVLFIIYTIIIA